MTKIYTLVYIYFQMWMIVILHPVRMVQPVWMNMVAIHVSVLNSGLVIIVQVP